MYLQKKVIVVLPSYNASATLKKTYIEIPLDIVDEVVLVDDKSWDNTVDIAKKLGIHHIIVHNENKGYGGNQKSCYEKALALNADIIVMLHPDYQYSPKLLRAMISVIGEGLYEVMFGSRILGKGALKGGMPMYKYIANRLLTLAQNLLMNQKLSEYHTGYRAYSASALKSIPYQKNSNDFIFDNQLIAQLFNAGFEIGEITCPTKYLDDSSSINFSRSVTYGFGVLGVSSGIFWQRLSYTSGTCLNFNMRYLTPKNTSIAISALALVVIFVLIIAQNGTMLYDERNFVPNIYLLLQLGLTKKFLMNISGSAGPTYAVIHYLFIGLTHLNLTYIRLTNFGLLLLLLVFVYLNARLLKAKDPIIITANFIIIPMVWVSCGLALTEVPAMLFAAASLYLLLQCFIINRTLIAQLILAILAGMLLSVAILDRSFFLMMALAAPILLLIRLLLLKFDPDFTAGTETVSWQLPAKSTSLLLLSIFLIFSLYLPLTTFFIWKALAPPQDTKLVGANNLSMVPWYGVLSFCYCGFITLILAPRWFVINKKILILTLALSFAFLVSNIYKGYFEFAPFLTAAIKFLSPGGFAIYQRSIPALVFLFAFHFVLSSLIRLWEYRHDPVFTFMGLVILFIAFSTIKVKAQFSSRYVAQIAPFFLLIFIRFERTNWQKVMRVLIGAGLGFISLYFYYHGG